MIDMWIKYAIIKKQLNKQYIVLWVQTHTYKGFLDSQLIIKKNTVSHKIRLL